MVWGLKMAQKKKTEPTVRDLMNGDAPAKTLLEYERAIHRLDRWRMKHKQTTHRLDRWLMEHERTTHRLNRWLWKWRSQWAQFEARLLRKFIGEQRQHRKEMGKENAEARWDKHPTPDDQLKIVESLLQERRQRSARESASRAADWLLEEFNKKLREHIWGRKDADVPGGLDKPELDKEIKFKPRSQRTLRDLISTVRKTRSDLGKM